MGLKKERRAPRKSTATSQKSRFPVGALAAERAVFKKEYLSKSKELATLKKKVMWLKVKVGKLPSLLFTKFPFTVLKQNKTVHFMSLTV
jgi:hypothetical protein